MAIPRNIFQTARSFEELPEEYKANAEKLKSLNPNWAYEFFDDERLLQYLYDKLTPQEWELVQQINPKYGVVLADIFRYLVIFNEGGVYLDIKSTAHRPFDEVLIPSFSYILSQWPNKLGERWQGFGLHPELDHVPGGEFQQWHIMAQAHHPFLKAVRSRVFENLRLYTPKSFGTDAYGVLRVTGPIAYTQAIYPLLEFCSFQTANLDSLKISYSLHEGSADKQKHERHSGHYSRVKEPILLKDSFVEPRRAWVQSLGEMLATELRENFEVVLKLAVIAFVFAGTMILGIITLLLSLVVGWHSMQLNALR